MKRDTLKPRIEEEFNRLIDWPDGYVPNVWPWFSIDGPGGTDKRWSSLFYSLDATTGRPKYKFVRNNELPEELRGKTFLELAPETPQRAIRAALKLIKPNFRTDTGQVVGAFWQNLSGLLTRLRSFNRYPKLPSGVNPLQGLLYLGDSSEKIVGYEKEIRKRLQTLISSPSPEAIFCFHAKLFGVNRDALSFHEHKLRRRRVWDEVFGSSTCPKCQIPRYHLGDDRIEDIANVVTTGEIGGATINMVDQYLRRYFPGWDALLKVAVEQNRLILESYEYHFQVKQRTFCRRLCPVEPPYLFKGHFHLEKFTGWYNLT